MFDITLRPLKDGLFEPLSRSIPLFVTPLQVTGVAFICGLTACLSVCMDHNIIGFALWVANRALDCLDGALARHRKQQSDLGGFLDLLGDFTVYALVPIACAWRNNRVGDGKGETDMIVISLLEAAFWINNFVLFYIAAHIEGKKGRGMQSETEEKELTSVAMRPALIEGFESGVFFSLMFLMPQHAGILSIIMFAGVVYGTWQRTRWFVVALKHTEKT